MLSGSFLAVFFIRTLNRDVLQHVKARIIILREVLGMLKSRASTAATDINGIKLAAT